MSTEHWRDFDQELISTMGPEGIEAWYTHELGVKVKARAKPNPRGYLQVHAYDREDRNASASISLTTGRYKDFAGDSFGLYEVSSKIKGCDWREARARIAKQFKVKLPRSKEERWQDKIILSPNVTSPLLELARRKNLDVLTVQAMGAVKADWHRQDVVAFPLWGGRALEDDPVGYTMLPPIGKHLSKFQGKGNAPELLPMISQGSGGLLNKAGLHRLAKCKKCFVCEGVSDTCRVEFHHPQADTEWAVIGLPGASFYPRADWLPLFEGIEMFICGDADHAGDKFMATWAAMICTINDRCTKVRLPYEVEEKHGKDISDWLAEDENRGWADITLLAEMGEMVRLDDEQVDALDPHKLLATDKHGGLLDNLEAEVLGEYGNTGKIAVFSQSSGKIAMINDINRLTYPKGLQIFGAEMRKFISPGSPAPAGTTELKELQNSIAIIAQQRVFDPKKLRGVGIWPVTDDRLVLVNSGYCSFYDRDGTFAKTKAVVMGEDRFDIHRDRDREWYNFEELEHYLSLAKNLKWCQGVMDELIGIFRNWKWKYPDSPELLAAMVVATFIQTVWHWRPHVALVGRSNTGKTYFAEDCLKHLFGKLSMYSMKVSEAGLRQHVRNNAFAINIDEFESDKAKAANLELARGASTGSVSYKGTADQSGINYLLMHIFWVMTTSLKLDHEADRNRWMLFETMPPDSYGGWTPPPAGYLNTLGQKLTAVALRIVWDSMSIWSELASLPARSDTSVNSRLVQCFGVPTSVLSAVYGHNPEETLLAIIGCRGTELAEQTRSEHEDVLNTLLAHTLYLDGGRRNTVAGVIQRMLRHDPPDQAEEKALSGAGIAIRGHTFRADRNNGHSTKHLSVFFANSIVPDKVLRGTRHDDKDLKVLSQLVHDGVRVETERSTIHGLKQRGWWVAVEDFMTRTIDDEPEFTFTSDEPMGK